MKNHFITVLVCLLFLSCGKEDPESQLVGFWELDRTIYTCILNSVQQEDLEITANPNGCTSINVQFQTITQCLSIEIVDNNAGTITRGEFFEEVITPFTYTLDEENNLIEICINGTECNTHTFVNNEIRISETLPIGGTDSCLTTFILSK